MTNAEARFSNSLRPRKPEGSLGRTAHGGHFESHTAPELYKASPSLIVLMFSLDIILFLKHTQKSIELNSTARVQSSGAM